MNVNLLKSDFDVYRGGYGEQIVGVFKPRRELPARHLELPLDWDMDPFTDRNWCFQLHAWRMLDPLWSQGLSGPQVKREVLPWVRDWYRYHMVEGRESRFMWYDMSTGLRAHHLALILHLAQIGELALGGTERVEIESLARLHIAKLMDESFISKGNHGLFQLTGLRLLGLVWAGRPEVASEEEYSNRLMEELVSAQFTRQGVHVENSPSYHNFAIAHFGRVRAALFPDAAALMTDLLGRARSIAPWFTLPDGLVSAIGDSEGTGSPFVPRICCSDVTSVSSSGDEIFVRDLTASGYAIIRTGPPTPTHCQEVLIIKAQAETTSHGHADHLTFELYARGIRLFSDSGKFSYDVNRWRSYFKSDRAHNVVGLVGRPFSVYDTQLEATNLSAVQQVGGAYEVKGQVSKKNGFTHQRTYAYRPGSYLTVTDVVDIESNDRPIAFYHLGLGVDAEVEGDGIALWASGRRVATLAYPSDVMTPHIVTGQQKPYIQGWVSPRYGARVPRTVIEFVGQPGLRSWEIAVCLGQPLAPSELLQRPLPHAICVPLHYSCRSDKVLINAKGAFERRVILEYYHGAVDHTAQILAEQFKNAGYHLLRTKAESGMTRLFYEHLDGGSASFLVRTREAFAVKTVAAVGSIYMSFTEKKERAAFVVGSVKNQGDDAAGAHLS